jgi:hypothetical protein
MANEFDAIVAKVQKAAEDFVTLKVTTVVGKFEFDPKTGEVTPKGADQKVIQSKINIVEGDIQDYVDDAYADDADHPMRKFHKDQVDNAKQTVNDSIEAFKSLVSVLVDLVKKRDEPGAGD